MKRPHSNSSVEHPGRHTRSSTSQLYRPSSSGINFSDLGFSSVKRPSFQRPQGAFTPTAARVPNDGEPHNDIYRSRRSTIGPISHRQSFFQATLQPAGAPKDPRPFKGRSYQARIGQELMDYMVQNNFEMEMKHVLLQNVIKLPT